MEARFRGHDFSRVRVHTDARAAESADALHALAYTVGADIVFASDRYQPHTADGRSLLGHELTHVIQQSRTRDNGGDLQIGEVNSTAEHEADAAARKLTAGRPVHVQPSIGRAQLQGKWDWGRAGWGVLIGAGVGGILGGLAAIALGPAAVFAGLGAGAVIGGLIGGLTGKEEQKPPSEKPAVLPAPGCTPTTDGMIGKGVQEGSTMVQTAISALSGLTAVAPGTAGAGRGAEALRAHFKSNDPRVASHVVHRLKQIHEFMSALVGKRASYRPKPNQPPDSTPVAPTECHTKENDDTCNQGVVAYVPAIQAGHAEREGMIFCPRFFEPSTARNDQERGGIIVHETAHSLSGGEPILDRGYSDQRFFPGLTTEEALTNADSYRILVLDIAGALQFKPGHLLIDILEECEPYQAKIDGALSRIQRWLSVAGKVVHDRRPNWQNLEYWIGMRRQFLGGDDQSLVDAAASAFDIVAGNVGSFIFARCHAKPDATCPAGTTTATVPQAFAPEIQLCPDWLTQPDADRQALLLFAEMLGNAGIKDPQARLRHAEMARKLFDDLGKAPSLEDILKPFGQPPPGSAPGSAPAQPPTVPKT